MPGPYIHMETARLAVERLRSGPSDFPGGADAARQLGELGYKWRNYLALGAIGPDLFFLLPDFKGTVGSVLLRFVDFSLTAWKEFDEQFFSKWEKWAAPAVSGAGEIPDALTGGVLSEIQADLNLVASALQDLVLSVLAKQYDWFALLGSGVPAGVAESLFFWSDIFHYRKTYEFPSTLFRKAGDDERLKAFALGWMSHCAADITGHPFVNAKCGGPYRLHWQRHHLIENHMDSFVYDDQHGGVEPYGELDTAAVHMRIAFRERRDDPPYSGDHHAPAYDYFAGFPDYTGHDDAYREHLWDLDSEDMPDDLCQLVIDAMTEVFPDRGEGEGHAPRILTDHPEYADPGPPPDRLPSGRPNVATLQEMFRTQYLYLKYMTTSGYRPPRPTPPDIINDHAPPPFPGSDGGLGDDPTRGADAPDDFNFVDLLLALFGWALWLGEVAAWLATLPAAVIADAATYPVRQALYDNVAVPLWQVYIAARRTLVMSGYLLPKHEEISRGLVELGISPTGINQSLAAALASPDGDAPAASLPYDEPSGRATDTSPRGVDPAFPRTVIRDRYDSALLPNFGSGHQLQTSEFFSPWRYPDTNNFGDTNGWEPPLSHPGPYQQGQDARILLDHFPGDADARAAFEGATSPSETEERCQTHLAANRHLGDPVDYTVYLVGKMADGSVSPDFNLDADRGYAHKCWDWNRDADKVVLPAHDKVEPLGTDTTDPKWQFHKPCTLPDPFFPLEPGETHDDLLVYEPGSGVPMATHYLDGSPGTCDDVPSSASEEDREIAMIPPEGRSKG